MTTVLPALFSSKDTFEFFHILRPAEQAKIPRREMTAELHLPQSRSTPCPAVVQLHGSFGWRPHHHKHRDNLLRNGYAVLQVNSFEARGVASTAERQIACTMAMQVYDAYQGLLWLERHQQGAVDMSRVGLAGWSLGGGAALYAGLTSVAEACAGNGGPRFAAFCAVYPGAMYLPTCGFEWTQRPLIVLVGDLDDYTPARITRRVTEHINKQGAKATVLAYAGSHHAFDNVDQELMWDGAFKAMNDGDPCTVDLHPDGSMNITGLPHAAYNTKEDRLTNGRKITRRGATVGGNAEQAARAFRDVLAFFDWTMAPSSPAAKL